MVAQVCDLKPGDFVHCLGDAHVYSNHVEALKVDTRDPQYPSIPLQLPANPPVNPPKPYTRLILADQDLGTCLAWSRPSGEGALEPALSERCRPGNGRIDSRPDPPMPRPTRARALPKFRP